MTTLASLPARHYLTPHFQVGEFTLWDPERAFLYRYQENTALGLAQFLEEVRGWFGGRPVIITSGHRPYAVNKRVGGTEDSEHLYDWPREGAVDFWVPGVKVADVWGMVDRRWAFSAGLYNAAGFIHLGRRVDGARRRW